MCSLVVALSEGGASGVRPLRRLFARALLYFLPQILRVVARHRQTNVVHKLNLRLREPLLKFPARIQIG